MDAIVNAWYQGSPWLRLLLPLSWLFRHLAARRRDAYQNGEKPVYRAPVPVIVVGNITVGGAGKTPVVAWLVGFLREQGYRPGVISRGYGGTAPKYPWVVYSDTPAELAGDEPVMLVRRMGCPLVVDPVRGNAAKCLLREADCDVIVCDDGMQHYALARDIEIAVLDGARGLGNGYCLPAGPLREPPERLGEVDLVVVNGDPQVPVPAPFHVMQLVPGKLVELHDGRQLALDAWSGAKRVHGVAGIGNPERFFQALERLGFEVVRHPFPDHHAYAAADFRFEEDLPVVMTEKDAVKCRGFARPGFWYLPVDADLGEGFAAALRERLQALRECPSGN